jgi:hypothetical protein
MRHSAAYVQHRKRGPFPGRIDPWAEVGRYFHQIHAGMIGDLLTQIQDPLIELGYEAGRETSLQILERREPDIYVHREESTVASVPPWDYPQAAQQVLAEPGLAIDFELPELDAIYVRDFRSGDLVTIVEIVSPSNKEQPVISEYGERRDRLIRGGINIVEIDPTRSVKRLLQDALVTTYAYHVAVYLPQQLPRIIGVDFGQPLKRVALPLRGEVVPMELQAAYDFAYQQASIAGHIHSEGAYTEPKLPFRSLLTEEQSKEALHAVEAWRQELAHLSQTPES